MDKEESSKSMLKVVGDVATALAPGLLVAGDRAGLFNAMQGGACWGEKRVRALARAAGFTRFERLEIRTAGLAFFALGTADAA